jgi:hypothetical protein
MVASRVENSAQVLSCWQKFVHGDIEPLPPESSREDCKNFEKTIARMVSSNLLAKSNQF